MWFNVGTCTLLAPEHRGKACRGLYGSDAQGGVAISKQNVYVSANARASRGCVQLVVISDSLRALVWIEGLHQVHLDCIYAVSEL